jgi:hypothetical protein
MARQNDPDVILAARRLTPARQRYVLANQLVTPNPLPRKDYSRGAFSDEQDQMDEGDPDGDG